MEISTISALNSDYSIAKKELDKLLETGKLKKNTISKLLKLENLTIIGDFLTEYQHFDNIDLVDIKKYILKNLDNSDRLFVSDLIEFASMWELELPYKKCIEMIKLYEDDHSYVQLAMISYLFENLKISYIEPLFTTLYDVLNNPECNQSVQVKAAFFLFRISHKKEFLIDLIDLVVNGQKNSELMYNLLQIDYNSKKYFDYYSLLLAILPPEYQKDSNT